MAAQLDEEGVRVLLDAVAAAPSIHNTQPWRFEVHPAGLRILADPQRQLRVVDPYARQLHISCGTAVFNARLALEHLGLEPRVRLLPEREHPRVLADVDVVGLRRGRRQPEREALFAAIPGRHTNRFPFADAPVPEPVQAALAAAAEAERATLVPLDDEERARLVALLAEATFLEDRDARVAEERRQWVGGPPERPDGVPEAALGPVPDDPRAPFRDLGRGGVADRRPAARFEQRATLAALVTEEDDPPAWLRAGQALQRTWLFATAEGYAVSFVNQPLERPEYRWLVRRLREGFGYPQMLLRLGRPVTPAPASPRLPPAATRAGNGFPR